MPLTTPSKIDVLLHDAVEYQKTLDEIQAVKVQLDKLSQRFDGLYRLYYDCMNAVSRLQDQVKHTR